MKKTLKTIFAIISVFVIIIACALPAFAAQAETTTEETTAVQQAEEKTADETTKAKIFAAAIMIAVVAAAGAVAMSIAISKGSEGISRQPGAAGDIRTNVMLGLVFIETAIIYALIVAILIIFVL